MFFEIPLSGRPQRIAVALGAITYLIRTGYADTPEGGWFMDIGDAVGNSLAAGIPLVTGADLLEQYAYLGIPGQIFVVTDDGTSEPPTFPGLGTTSHLIFRPF